MTGPDPHAPVPNLSVAMSFTQAANAVLDYLHGQVPLGLWGITHHDGDEQVFLHLRDQTYGVHDGASAPWPDSLCQRMVDGAPTIAPRAVDVAAYADTVPVREWGVRAYVGAPIRTEDRVFGSLCGYHGEELDETAVAFLEPTVSLLAQLLTQILVAEKLRERSFIREAELRRVATRDHLTGLATRSVFYDRLEHALNLHAGSTRPLSLLLLDVDDFKAVNDTLGHGAGDALLVQLATSWRSTVSPGNTLARLGGDEFALLVENGLDRATVMARVGTVLARTYDIAGTALKVGISVGVAHLAPGAPTPAASELLAHADAALYAAKRSGKGRAVCYDPTAAAVFTAPASFTDPAAATPREDQLHDPGQDLN